MISNFIRNKISRHLRSIERPYTVAGVKKYVEREVARSFECVNIDYMFDLPGQTCAEDEVIR